MRRFGKLGMIAIVGVAALSVGATPSTPIVDLATPFEQVAEATAGKPETERIAAVRERFEQLLPGLYPQGPRMDQRIAKALVEFPARRTGYEQVTRGFPRTLDSAVDRFRTIFPNFTSPLPIYVYHSLGIRDGGTDYLEPGHRNVMLFGADVIAKTHADDSLEPFMDHELFHLEHAHAFPDCDQFWCGLWQEGLAVDAAAAMNPGASDRQLLIDGIRAPADAHWADALCFVAVHFDETDASVIAQAFQGNGKSPSGLPDRFGYYVGYRVAQATGQSMPDLDRLDHAAARRVLRKTLMGLMSDAQANCMPPEPDAAITPNAPP